MASRSELVQMMEELGLDYKGLKINQMAQAVREEADRLWADKPFKISGDGLSDTLKHFLVYEFDYVFKDRDGKIIKEKA